MTLTHDTDTMRAEIAAHIADDAVQAGHYWRDGTGCFIGCLAHSSDASVLFDRFGLPLPIVRLCEHIFERSDEPDRVPFFSAVGAALRDGQKDNPPDMGANRTIGKGK